MAKFEIYDAIEPSGEKNGLFFFVFRETDQDLILESEEFKTKQEAKDAIELIKSPKDDLPKYEIIYTDMACYFVIKGENGKTLATSALMYTTKQNTTNVINKVKKEAPSASVHDETGK